MNIMCKLSLQLIMFSRCFNLISHHFLRNLEKMLLKFSKGEKINIFLTAKYEIEPYKKTSKNSN